MLNPWIMEKEFYQFMAIPSRKLMGFR